MELVPFVPKHYVVRAASPAVWAAPSEDASAIELIATTAQRASTAVRFVLEVEAHRSLQLCVFDSAETMRAALRRDVPLTMLAMPYCDDRVSLVTLASPRLGPACRDERRLVRHLAHELAHAIVAEVMGTVKSLGDVGGERRIATWLDEGIAELVSRTVAGTLAPRADLPPNLAGWTEREADAALDDLASERRAEAFAWSLHRVQALASDGGVAKLLRSLQDARRA